jgi:hypothetical protein
MEKRFRRKEAAQFLTDMGLPTAAATLAKYAVVGGGPTFQVWGRLPVYPESSLIAWAEQRLGKPASTTTEHQANRAA